MPSFDVVSRVDMQEVDNAVNQARKEINTRYDFKNTKCSIELDKTAITLFADDKMKLNALLDILNQKMVKRGIGVKALEHSQAEEASGGSLRQKIQIKQGISSEDGRNIVKLIKDQKFKKIQAQIQDDQIRVTGPKRDDLQEVISFLRQKVSNIELQFTNFKD